MIKAAFFNAKSLEVNNYLITFATEQLLIRQW